MSESERLSLLRLDQRRRWRRGEPLPVEGYLERHPALHADPDGVLDLIYNEMLLAEEAGARPELAEYLRRFPRFDAEIRLLFEVHQALEGDSLPETDSVPRQRAVPAARDGGGDAVPGYEVLGEIGRGGMGVVYKARQVALKRLVALKMILAGQHAGPGEVARFRREAEAVARLQHPNIVQIYEVGEHDGRPYLALEYVDGGSLAQRLREAPSAVREAAELVETLARAVDYAHRRGIVHRDLKPANVLLVRSDPIHGVLLGTGPAEAGHYEPKITDFGLAKLADAGADQTPSEAFLGTPHYMAPEQAAGKSKDIGPAADVYALGAILYECLTGRPPFQGATPLDTLEQVRTREPVRPSRLRPQVPRDLETICLKCLEKDPAKRYAAACGLADDLRRFLNHEPILARPASWGQRAVKWARRRPERALLTAVTAVAAVAVVALLAGSVWYGVTEPRRRAEAARRRADETYREFVRLHDEALFHGMDSLSGGTLLTGMDAAANLQASADAARKALRLAGVGGDAEEAAPDLGWDGDQRAEVTARCYTLLVLLADGTARQAPGEEGSRRALQVLDRVPQLGAPTRAYHLRRARYLEQLGDEAAARQEQARAEALPPSTALDYFLLGDLHYKQGEWQEAARAFETVTGLRPDDFWGRCCLALCLFRLGKWERAESSLAVCLVQRPEFVWGYLLRGIANRELQAFPAAEADFRQAERLLGQTPNAAAGYILHVNRGILRLRQDRLEEAAADFTQAVRMRPEQYTAHVNLARVFQRQQKGDEADRQLRQAVRLGAPALVVADYHEERGRDLYRARRYEESAAACREALAQRPDYPAAYEVLGHALLQLKRHAEAAKAFDGYIKHGEKPLADVYRGRGQARVQLGNYLGAVDDYTRALELAAGVEEKALLADTQAHRGWAYFFADAFKPALRDFDEAIRLDGDNRDAYVGRGLARVMLGRYRDAVADAEEALRRRPDTPEMMHNLACVFAQAAGRAESDTTEPARAALAADYRGRALKAVRDALALVPAEARFRFWRDKVLSDAALDPIRTTAEFRRLAEEVEPPGEKK
jgi:eukaryotic-like serine/threonine-protein kinase